MAFTYVTVTHTFELANDVAAAGVIEFTLVTPMHNGTTTVPTTPVTATLTGAGVLSQPLTANTDPGTQPGGATYQVVERLTGQKPLTYYVQVPHDQGSTIDLATLTDWVGGSSAGAGGGAVATINGEGPDGFGNVVLSAADVGAQLADGDLTGLAGLGDGIPRRASGTWGLVTGTPDGTKFLRDDGTWAAATGGTSYTDEQVDDRVNTLLIAGTNITKIYDDTANTLTLNAATTGSSGIPASTVDAKGDLIVGTANDTVARRSVGTDGQVLVADSAQTTGVSWAAPTPADGSVTNAKVAVGAAISADKLADGTTLKVMTATERTTLATADTRLDALDGVSNIGSVGSTLAVTPGGGNGTVKTITLSSATCTMTFNNPSTSTRAFTLEFVITQDATGGRTVIWPGSVKWAGGIAPTLSGTGNAVDRLLFVTYNGGTTWYGDLIGKGYL